MKRAVSISIGSPTRDHRVVVELLGQQVSIERIGTDGSFERAIQMFRELDGQVDAFGVGGADLGVTVFGKHYPFYDALRLVSQVHQTPYTDGVGLKNTLERRGVPYLEAHADGNGQPRRALVCTASDRFGMALSFFDAGYSERDVVFGDLMFGLGIGIPIRGLSALKRVAALLMPIVGHFPMKMLYPTGQEQERHTPKYGKWFDWATILAGDCMYLKRYGPANMAGKTVFTNTTTQADIEMFRQRGVRYLLTSTPRLDGGRSFGTNAMEAALIAVAGKGRRLTDDELNALIDELGLLPSLEQLNP